MLTPPPLADEVRYLGGDDRRVAHGDGALAVLTALDAQCGGRSQSVDSLH